MKFSGSGSGSGGSSSITAPIIGKDFTWTGDDSTYLVLNDGDNNWRIKFLSSGVFTPLKDMTIDSFLVSGGGSGSYYSHFTPEESSAGGGGGYTKTIKAISLKANTPYDIVVGAGGAALTSNGTGNAGGDTSAFGETVTGGFGGGKYDTGSKASIGGNGGSGGGGGAVKSKYVGNGGSDGSDGTRNGGTGQGTTTKEFGENTGKLYSGGGGGYRRSSKETTLGTGGDGGGADAKNSASDNTGGGGGAQGGAGGSGIVIIRNCRS